MSEKLLMRLKKGLKRCDRLFVWNYGGSELINEFEAKCSSDMESQKKAFFVLKDNCFIFDYFL